MQLRHIRPGSVDWYDALETDAPPTGAQSTDVAWNALDDRPQQQAASEQSSDAQRALGGPATTG